jgi:hypothetical protein
VSNRGVSKRVINRDGREGWREAFRDAKRLFFLSIGISNSGGRRLRPDLRQIPAGEGWQVDNCAASIVDHEGRYALQLGPQSGNGTVWFLNHQFTTGKIDLRLAAIGQETGLILRPLSGDAPDRFGFKFSFSPTSIDLLVWMEAGRQRQEARHQFPLKMKGEWIPIRIMVSRELLALFVDRDHVPSLKATHGHSAERPARIGIWRGPDAMSLLADLKLIETDEWDLK